MDVQRRPLLFGRAAQRHCRVIGAYGGGGQRIYNDLNILSKGGGAQHQNLLLHKSSLPQAGGVPRLGDAEAPHPLLPQQTGHGQQAQTVGVGFEHCDELAAPGLFADNLEVMYDFVFFYHKPRHVFPLPQAPVIAPPVFPLCRPFWFCAQKRRGASRARP